MSVRNKTQARSTQADVWKDLAYGISGDGPPGGRPRLATEMDPPDPSLTVKFNRAAKQPVMNDKSKDSDIQLKIDALRRQMSKNVNTFEMSPLGTIHSTIQSNRDQWLAKTIKALEEQILSNDNQQQKGMGITPKENKGLEGNKGLAKQQFNHAAKGLGS